MTASSPQETPSQEAPVLYCPHCEYNLTGLTELRCPECGEAFDPEALKAEARRGRLLPREAGSSPWLEAQWKVWLAWIAHAMFHPVQVARSMPLVYRKEEAYTIGLQMRLLSSATVLGYLLLFAVLGLTWEVIPFILTGFGVLIWIVSYLVEGLVLTVLSLIVPRRPPGDQVLPPYLTSSWYGLLALHAGSLWIMIHALFLLFLTALLDDVSAIPDPIVVMLYWLLIGMPIVLPFWWLINICIGVYLQSRDKGRAITAIVVLPLTLLAALFVLGSGCGFGF